MDQSKILLFGKELKEGIKYEVNWVSLCYNIQ